MADREFDRKVERTRTRPLASGELSMRQAFIVLIVLLCLALLIALQMNMSVLILAVASLPLVVSYPFMKRFTWWPQAFLGLTFNWGALMGWAAVRGEVQLPALLLYGGVFWTLGYDTLYAHQDKVDDIHAGVKSTALRLGKNSKYWITAFYGIALICWVMAYNISVLIPAGFHMVWQVKRVNLDNPASCMHVFRSNTMLGFLVLVWLFLGCYFNYLFTISQEAGHFGFF
jgi:4-hydroxybenzoate polyprenyltransferase